MPVTSARVVGFGPDWFEQVGLPALHAQMERWGEVPKSAKLPGEVPALVRSVIDDAIGEGASDLHWEPGPEQLVLRVRYDGTLLTEQTYPYELHQKVTTHLKALANLDITERRRPQDGRIGWNGNGRRVDLRVSTVPGAHGEKTVLRILDSSKLSEDLSELGIEQRTAGALQGASERSRGLVLITGPTGSGKSTTLYTLLRSMDRESRNIMTVEDPVEYELSGITQVSVDTRVGRTFANVLRSFLRQDPDVLLVGEVRDLETAEICIRASLTGHLVLSTLHTNDAPGAVIRLLDMGVPPFLLASSLSVVTAQRLLRRLCPECRKPDERARTLLERFDLSHLLTSQPMHAPGCAHCRGQGVKGRIGVYETLIVSDRAEEAIRAGVSTRELADLAKAEGLVPLVEQGLRLVSQGMVSAREVATQVLSANRQGMNS